MSSSPPMSSFPQSSLSYFLFLPSCSIAVFLCKRTHFFYCSELVYSLSPGLPPQQSFPPIQQLFNSHPSLSRLHFTHFNSLSSIPQFFDPFPSSFSISASLINNASQCIKNISRVLLTVKERGETREREDWVTPF